MPRDWNYPNYPSYIGIFIGDGHILREFTVTILSTVFKAKGKVLALSKLGSKDCEEKAATEVDYSKLTFNKVARLRMESEMKVQRLRKELDVERIKFSSMKKEGKEVCMMAFTKETANT